MRFVHIRVQTVVEYSVSEHPQERVNDARLFAGGFFVHLGRDAPQLVGRRRLVVDPVNQVEYEERDGEEDLVMIAFKANFIPDTTCPPARPSTSHC